MPVNSLTGTETSPKLMVPDEIARGAMPLAPFGDSSAIIPARPPPGERFCAMSEPRMGAPDLSTPTAASATPPARPSPRDRRASGACAPRRQRFVVQQHAARRLHWDLRLEIDGVLVSWAIPRGPSVRHQGRRLAVQTEDHPIEYGRLRGPHPRRQLRRRRDDRLGLAARYSSSTASNAGRASARPASSTSSCAATSCAGAGRSCGPKGERRHASGCCFKKADAVVGGSGAGRARCRSRWCRA